MVTWDAGRDRINTVPFASVTVWLCCLGAAATSTDSLLEHGSEQPEIFSSTRPGASQVVKGLWPRPLLVVHGLNDDVIPFEHGERLFEAAYEPKRRVWLTAEDYEHSLSSKEALREVRQFFDEAVDVPTI